MIPSNRKRSRKASAQTSQNAGLSWITIKRPGYSLIMELHKNSVMNSLLQSLSVTFVYLTDHLSLILSDLAVSLCRGRLTKKVSARIFTTQLAYNNSSLAKMTNVSNNHTLGNYQSFIALAGSLPLKESLNVRAFLDRLLRASAPIFHICTPRSVRMINSSSVFRIEGVLASFLLS